MMKKYSIVLADLGETVGSEQAGIRPCLVVQNDVACVYSNTVSVCPFTSVEKVYPHTLRVRPSKRNGLSKVSRVDILQIRTIDKQRVKKILGELDLKYYREFSERFIDSFDLFNIFRLV